MLKSFIEYLIELKRPEVVKENIRGIDRTFSTSGLTLLDKEKSVDAITIRSLSGLVDYINSNFDHERKLMIHIESPTSVRVFDALNEDNDRRTYVKAVAMLPEITLERYMDREEFNVMLQACFVNDETDKEKVLQVISSIVEENSITQSDDGLTQRVAARTGIATTGLAEVPNPVTLKPFRTFVEVPQPESDFVLRLKEGARVGLFEADGGAWELNAMANIQLHLIEQLGDLIDAGKVIIVS